MVAKESTLQDKKYNSFLNRLMLEFSKSTETADYKTQKRLLGFSLSLVEAFREVYGDHELKDASSPESRMLAEIMTPNN